MKENELGGLGEVIFMEIMEFDPGFKGSSTCVWRKGSGEGQRRRPFIYLFIQQIYLDLSYVPDAVLGTGHRVENNKFTLMELTF